LLFLVATKAFAWISEKIKFTNQTKALACGIWEVWFKKCPTPHIRNVVGNAKKRQCY
jgi:hypothetical protein